METKTKKSRSARVMRFLGRAVPAVFAATVLVACGGGGGGGGGDRGAAAPQPCDSQNSRGPGFALGSCAATATNVFQPVESDVVINGTDAYTMTLDFPSDLSSLDGTTGFTAANKPPELRNIIGELRGQAYENPAQPTAQLTPPYVALTDFFQARDRVSGGVVLSLQFAGFGTWEKFAGSGLAAFNEGYLGTWYASRPGAGTVTNQAPTIAGVYEGFVAGVIGDDGTRTPRVLNGRFGFSAPITLEVNAGGTIASATLGALSISFQEAGSSTLRTAQLALNTITFGASSVPPVAAGTVSSAAGAEASSSGVYQADYFGISGNLGEEIAGRLRFTTSNGLVAVGAFGAVRQ